MAAAASLYRREIGERLWRGEPLDRPSGLLTVPLSAAYETILAARSLWWRRMARRASLPVVSVGNLTVGGNGKTPFTLFLASRMQAHGLRVAIVSRGYGANAHQRAALVSDGTKVLMGANAAGDEAVMMANAFDGPVAIARRRIHAIELLKARSLADVVLLDDAFQHIRLGRDLDLVLVNETRGLGNGWLLPAGPMREPKSAIQRADAVVLISSAGSLATQRKTIEEVVGEKPLFRAVLKPTGLISCIDAKCEEVPLELAGRRVVAISGIAEPAGFHSMIQLLGAQLKSSLDYPDHHEYNSDDWRRILETKRAGDILVTTEKDLVKLERFVTSDFPLYALRVSVTMELADEERLLKMTLEKIGCPASIKKEGCLLCP